MVPVVTRLLAAPVAALSWIGRQGARAVALISLIGIAVPPLGAWLKPFVAEAVFLLLCIAFLSVDPAALRGCLRRPRLIALATAWTSLVLPSLLCGVFLALGLKERVPELFIGLVLQAAASPMMAAPALAALMGLDATLVLVTMVISTLLVPLTASLFTQVVIGPGLAVSPSALGLKLLVILAGSAVVGFAGRRLADPAALARHKPAIDGFNILVLFVFVAAMMESLAARFWSAPWHTLGLTLLAFAVFFAMLGLTLLVFACTGRETAFAVGFMASQRNMGLMAAATAGALPELAWAYFALSQFPVYLSPQLMQPLLRWVRGWWRALPY